MTHKSAKMSEKQIAHTAPINFYDTVADILRSARTNAYRAVNFAMVEAYWNVGRMIVEEEQKGKERAEYGQALLANLSRRLAKEFGDGFSERNLRNFRQFYLCFPIHHTLCDKSSPETNTQGKGSAEPSPIRHAVSAESSHSTDGYSADRPGILRSLRGELTWTHYRLLLRVDKPDARTWYMNEAAELNWSVRALERQITSLYYERLIRRGLSQIYGRRSAAA
jgi:hypothetical protein